MGFGLLLASLSVLFRSMSMLLVVNICITWQSGVDRVPAQIQSFNTQILKAKTLPICVKCILFKIGAGIITKMREIVRGLLVRNVVAIAIEW